MYLSSITCMTTDLGVESAIGDAANMDIDDILTQFQQFYYGDPEDVCQQCDDAGTSSFLMDNCVSCAGICHILHNATEDLVGTMNKREFRKAFLARCMDPDADDSEGKRLNHFTASLKEHRWGYLVSACQQTTDLEHLLRLYWDPQKLTP